MAHPPRIVLSRFDFAQLESILRNYGSRPDLDALRDELERAEIVEPESVPATVVTMNSSVRFLDEESGRESEITLVYPAFADIEANRISVLAPVGAALLGLSVGDSIDWPMPNSRTRSLKVVAVTYQPEAAGAPLQTSPGPESGRRPSPPR
jgi:regulator of nucleoside diphosphate kinase